MLLELKVLSRYMLTHSNLNLLRYSAPFKFEGEPIEYCLSIVVEDDRVILNYSTAI